MDGNEYIDYLSAFGPLILGHKNPSVMDTVRNVLDEMGSWLGTSHYRELEAAQKVVKAIPCYDLVRFANTGSEAVTAALSIARAYTGKKKIVRFEGHFHGLGEVIHFSTKPPLEKAGSYKSPKPVSGSWGIPDEFGKLLIIKPWNDKKVIEETKKSAPTKLQQSFSNRLWPTVLSSLQLKGIWSSSES